jgi:peptidyl-prolyl cis-trans isomerase A (cyclophilin A)
MTRVDPRGTSSSSCRKSNKNGNRSTSGRIVSPLGWWTSAVSTWLLIVIGTSVYFGFLSFSDNRAVVDPKEHHHDHPIMPQEYDSEHSQEEQELHLLVNQERNADNNPNSIIRSKCPISTMSQLSLDELHPVAGKRHMITPPSDDDDVDDYNSTIGRRGKDDKPKLSLVCCTTTKGPISILLHYRWAPLGVTRFLEMVEAGYFSTRVALFRCTDACQFGLASNTTWTKRFSTPLLDDPPWLPLGPDHRQTENGVKRYPEGFLTYAGSGANSRSNQFVVTLKPNQFMGGGSPWEVPLGELVGTASFDTLHQFHTGYGEHGPSQKILRRDGITDRIAKEWPLLDYITACHLLETK